MMDEVCTAYEVPYDVKEGYFAVSVVNGGTPKRFVVSLGYLNHPEFVKLLDKAAEEFGFKQQGALAVPCLASDLQSILADSWKGGYCDSEWEWEVSNTYQRTFKLASFTLYWLIRGE